MDRWKSRGGKSQRREENKKEDQRRERVRRQKMQLREKVAKSRHTVFFQWFVAPDGRQVGSLKWRVRSHLGRWDEKVQAVVARSTFPNHNAQNTQFSDHFWKWDDKKCTPLWRAAHFEVKMCKTHHSQTTFGWWNSCTPLHQLRSTFGSWDDEKLPAVVAPSQNVKTLHSWTTLDVQMSFCTAGARYLHLAKSEQKHEGFVACPKRMAGVGHFQRICKDACRVEGAIQETCSSEMLGGQGGDFLRGVAFWSMRSSRFVKMILRDRCSTSHDLASLCHGRRSTLHRWSGKIAKRIGTRPSALHPTPFLKEVSQNCFVFVVVNFENCECLVEVLKIEEVSQNCFVSDVVKFKNWGSLAELLRFWCCHTLSKSRRIASFSSLPIDR